MQPEAFWRRCGDVGEDQSTGERLEDWSGEPARSAPGRTPPGHSARSPPAGPARGSPGEDGSQAPLRMFCERYAHDTRTIREQPGDRNMKGDD